ncbi:MAG: Crp/Fnr family transcriptional regulator [Acidimicrobiales bacterium]
MTSPTADAAVELLAASFLGVLPTETLARIAADGLAGGVLGAGRLLYEPELSVIINGRIRAFITGRDARQLTVGYLSAPCSVGLTHAAGRRYPTAFQCITPVHLVMVGNQRFAELLGTHPRLGWSAAEEISTRLDGVEGELARVAFGSLRQRIAYHLLALLPAGQDERLPVHQAELAAAVGSVREVVARTLAQLRQQNLVDVDVRGIVIADRSGLARLAEL